MFSTRRERVLQYLEREKWYTAIDCLLDYCEELEHRIQLLESRSERVGQNEEPNSHPNFLQDEP